MAHLIDIHMFFAPGGSVQTGKNFGKVSIRLKKVFKRRIAAAESGKHFVPVNGSAAQKIL